MAGLAVLIFLGLLFVVIILPIVALVRLSGLSQAMTSDVEQLRGRLGDVELALTQLRKTLEAQGLETRPPAASPAGQTVAPVPVAAPEQVTPPVVATAPAAEPPKIPVAQGFSPAKDARPAAPEEAIKDVRPVATAADTASRAPVSTAPPAAPFVIPVPSGAGGASAPPVIPVRSGAGGASAPPVTPAADASGPPRGAPAHKPPSLPSPVPAPLLADTGEPPRQFDWESLVGVKLFSWIAGIAMVIAGLFFLRYSIDQGWLQPPVRVAIGTIVGVALLVICELKAARNYPVTANALDAAGIALLFSTFFAAHALWQLFGPRDSAFAIGITFGLLVAVAAVAVLLSIRRDSLFIALLGLVGGFATPALLSTGQDNPFGLFGYLLILNAGLSAVAYRKKWPMLTALCLLLTTFYQWGWVFTFLTRSVDEKLPIALGVFLAFPLLAVLSLWIARRRGAARDGSFYGHVASFSAALPLLFALYMATGPAFVHHYATLFAFTFVLDVGLFVIAAARGPEELHLGGAAATLVVFWSWLANAYAAGIVSASWPVLLGFLALFVLFHLLAPLAAPRLGGEFKGAGAYAIFAAPALLSVITGLAAFESMSATPAWPFTVLFALNVAIAVVAIRTRAPALVFVAALFTLSAEAFWSAQYLTPETLASALVMYAAFGLFYLSVPMVARRVGRAIQPGWAGAVLLLASLALLFFPGREDVAASSLGGLALLLAILNVALFAECRAARLPGLFSAGSLVSWLIIGFWWTGAPVGTMLDAALLVVAGYAILTLVGHVSLARVTEPGSPARESIFVSLAWFFFLVGVVQNPDLSMPPWSWLAILAALLLATGVAALGARRGELHIAGMVLSQIVLIAWSAAGHDATWMEVAIACAIAVAAIGGVWMWLALRSRAEPLLFDAGAAAGLVLAQLVGTVAAAHAGSPGVVFLASSHVVLLVALFALATYRSWYSLALGAVVLPSLGPLLWRLARPDAADWLAGIGTAPWYDALVFAIPVYLVCIAYPLVLRGRHRAAAAPYQAAVLASVPFFFVARQAFIDGGLSGIIGAVPVAQAALIGLLLLRLLRIEPTGQRNLGRLALVAAAALAFVTVAIPLQLDHQWITIGWALEGAALAWLFTRIPHRGLLWWSVVLLAAVFVRLAFNPAVFEYQARSDLRIWNWYLYTYVVTAAAMLAAGSLFGKRGDRFEELPPASALMKAGGTVLLFILLNIEIADFYSEGATIAFRLSGSFAQDLTYTLGWAAFGLALLLAGIVLRSHAARIAALCLLTVTVFKCFLYDLRNLEGLYRVASFVGLALCLALVAVVLQKFVLSIRVKERT